MKRRRGLKSEFLKNEWPSFSKQKKQRLIGAFRAFADANRKTRIEKKKLTEVDAAKIESAGKLIDELLGDDNVFAISFNSILYRYTKKFVNSKQYMKNMRELAELAREHLGENSRITIRALAQVADQYVNQGDQNRSEAIIEKLIRNLAETPGFPQWRAVDFLHVRAIDLAFRDPDKAQRLLKQARKILKEDLGLKPDTLQKYDRARACIDLDDPEGAWECGKDLLAVIPIGNSRRPFAQAILSQAAARIFAQSRKQEYLDAAKENLNALQETYLEATDHQPVSKGEIEWRMALAYEDLGNAKESLKFAEHSFLSYGQIPPKEHKPKPGLSSACLIVRYSLMTENNKKALKHANLLLSERKSLSMPGYEHLKRKALYNIAAALITNNKENEGLKIQSEALAFARRQLQDDSPNRNIWEKEIQRLKQLIK